MEPRSVAEAPPASPWLNASQAATYTHRGRRFILREVAAGRLRAARIGGRGEILTRTAWLDQWIEQHTTPIEISSRRKGAA